MDNNSLKPLDEVVKQTAVAFLSNIHLNLKDACPKCKHTQSKSLKDEVAKLDEDHGDSLIKLNQSELLLRNTPGYRRSMSSTADLPVLRSFNRKRQFSLTEAVPARVSCSGDGTSEFAKQKSSVPVMKMKFLSEKHMQNCRLFFVEPTHNTPCLVYSVLPYVKDNLKLRNTANVETVKNKYLAGPEQQNILALPSDGSASKSNQEISYQFLLVPSIPVIDVNLDCAEWMSGKHRTVLALNSYTVSIVGYTKPSELKKDLNQQFKSSFPGVNITLSKVRSLERQMHRTAKSFGMQTGILSCAKTYFKRLVFSGLVNKENRQQVAATCFLLAAKVHGDLKSDEIRHLVSSLEHSFKSSKSTFVSMEFSIFTALSFSLLLNPTSRNLNGDQQPHFECL